jgi:hypothetical protein
MKHQYFGDARDYLKYDVLDRLASDLRGIETLTCLWMLTPSDNTGQGQVAFVPDAELEELTAFFKERFTDPDSERRRVSEMANYFAPRPFSFVSYGDEDETFSMSTRTRYFREVPGEALQRAIVFFDPDTGMEPSRSDEHHLRFGELASNFERMDETSVAVVFQFARRGEGWLEEIAEQIAVDVSPHVGWIYEHPLALFVVAKSVERLRESEGVLAAVASRHTPGKGTPRTVSHRGERTQGPPRTGGPSA